MPNHTSAPDMSFGTAHALAKDIFEGLSSHVHDFTLTHQPEADQYAVQAVLQGSEADRALRTATERLSAIPRNHLTRLGELAVTQSDPEAMHGWSARAQREAVVIKDLLLSILSPGERLSVLGQ